MKKAADYDTADKILKYLFKKTDLQCNVSFNMVALANGKPQTMGLKTIITHYVNHQKDIVTRRSIKELAMAEKRFHIVEGFINCLNEIIKTIRESKSKKDAGINLVEKFGFTEMQAEAILELMLYRLTGLEIKVFQKEYAELEKTIKRLRKILSDEKTLLNVVKTELKEITDKYRNPRRTMIVEDDSEAKIDLQELIVVEDVMVTLSKDGFIKRIPVRTYQRSNAKAEDIEYREGDELKFLFKSNTTENILLFTDKGNMYQVKGINIPEGKWKEKGERIDSIIKTLNCDDEKIVEAISVGVLDSNKSVQFITNRGIIKKSTLDKFQTNYSKIQAIKLKENEFVLDIEILDNNEEKEFLKVETKLGLKFSLELPKIEDTPRNILGTQLFNLIESDEIIKVEYLNEFEFMTFSVGVTAKGSLKGFARAKASDRLKVNTDSISTLLLFTNKGNVYKIPSFLISNVVKEEISLENIIDGYSKNEKIIDVHSIKNFDERNMVYFFTKKGMIKKTSLKEYDGNYSIWQAYKFKYENDEVISVCIEDYSESEVLIISKKGMAIRFLSDNVNPMGRIAAGVTGISLKEDDEVIYGKIIDITSNNSDEIAVDTSRSFEVVLITSSKEKKTISTEEIRIQNRAGRGTNVMVISLDDEITEVQFS